MTSNWMVHFIIWTDTDLMANMQEQHHLLSFQTERAGHHSTMAALITTRNLCKSWEMQEQIQMQSMCGKTENTVILYSYNLLTHRNFPLSPLYIIMHYPKKLVGHFNRESAWMSPFQPMSSIFVISNCTCATTLSVCCHFLLDVHC